MSRLIDADALMADCQLAQKQADRHGREFANAFYSGGGEISTEWWCVEDMIENAPTIEPERKTGRLIHESAYNWYRCSVCKKVYSEALLQNFNECMYQPCFRYCPNCGARMEEGEE